jgi:hypothetical protein
MFYTVGHDNKFAGIKLHRRTVAEIHAQPTMHDEEQFVLAIMVVLMERSFELGELKLEIVNIASDLRAPVIEKF